MQSDARRKDLTVGFIIIYSFLSWSYSLKMKLRSFAVGNYLLQVIKTSVYPTKNITIPNIPKNMAYKEIFFKLERNIEVSDHLYYCFLFWKVLVIITIKSSLNVSHDVFNILRLFQNITFSWDKWEGLGNFERRLNCF